MQHGRAAALGRKGKVAHPQAGILDQQRGLVIAGWAANHGELVGQAGSEHAGWQLEITRAFHHAQQIAHAHAFQSDLAVRHQRVQADIAFPFERAALFGQFGRHQVVAAIFSQRRQAIQLDAEGCQRHLERQANPIGIGVINIAVGNRNMVDQHAWNRVRRRLLVFFELVEQALPVEPPARPHQ